MSRFELVMDTCRKAHSQKFADCGYPHVVRFKGSQPERNELKKSWHDMITHSEHAQADLKKALKDRDLIVRPTTGGAYGDPVDNSINVDPNFHPVVQTTAGPQPAPTKAILGHDWVTVPGGTTMAPVA